MAVVSLVEWLSMVLEMVTFYRVRTTSNISGPAFRVQKTDFVLKFTIIIVIVCWYTHKHIQIHYFIVGDSNSGDPDPTVGPSQYLLYHFMIAYVPDKNLYVISSDND